MSLGGQRAVILGLYRDLIRLSKVALPSRTELKIGSTASLTFQEDAIQEIRESFRKNGKETDATKIEQLIKKGISKLEFLQVVSPKNVVLKRESQHGTTTFVVEGGKVIERSIPKVYEKGAFKDPTQIDSESFARHERLNKRYHFMDRK